MMFIGLLGLTWLLQQTFLTVSDWTCRMTVDEEFVERNREYLDKLYEDNEWEDYLETLEDDIDDIEHEE